MDPPSEPSASSYNGAAPNRYKTPTTRSSNKYTKRMAVKVDKDTREITVHLRDEPTSADGDEAVRKSLCKLQELNQLSTGEKLQARNFFTELSNAVNSVRVGFGHHTWRKHIPPSREWYARVYDEDRKPGEWAAEVTEDNGYKEFSLVDYANPAKTEDPGALATSVQSEAADTVAGRPGRGFDQRTGNWQQQKSGVGSPESQVADTFPQSSAGGRVGSERTFTQATRSRGGNRGGRGRGSRGPGRGEGAGTVELPVTSTIAPESTGVPAGSVGSAFHGIRGGSGFRGQRGRGRGRGERGGRDPLSSTD